MDKLIVLRNPESTILAPSELNQMEQDSIFLHQTLEQITPNELKEILLQSTENAVQTLEEDNTVILDNSFGVITFYDNCPGQTWDEDSATDELLISCILKGVVFNDPKKLVELSCNYSSGQLTIINDNLVYQTVLTLKGGRSTENLLWSLISYVNDAERIFKDITVFDK